MPALKQAVIETAYPLSGVSNLAERGVNQLFDYGGLIVALLLAWGVTLLAAYILFLRNQGMAKDNIKAISANAAANAVLARSLDENTRETRALREAINAAVSK